MKRTARFFQRVLALAFLLLSFLLLSAALLGALPVIGAIMLLPAALLVTGRLLALSLRPAARRTAPQNRQPPRRPAAAKSHRGLRLYRRPARPPQTPTRAA